MRDSDKHQKPRDKHAESSRSTAELSAALSRLVSAATMSRSGVAISAGADTPYPSRRSLNRSRVSNVVSTPSTAS